MKLTRPLQGSIVTLRTIELADAQRCAVWLSDPNILRYMMTPTQTVESERTWIRKVRRSPTELVVSIQVSEENGHLRHVGNCGLHRMDRVNGTAEAGIFIGDTSMHGRGVGQDAIKTLARYAFNDLGLFKIWARVYGPNIASRKMCARAGLVEEGVLRGHRVLPDVGRIDEHLFAAFANTWSI